MILSVSRRTDIPNYYSDWLFNRLREGFLYVRNPMNPHQISRISLSAQVVDCIVFWTKNPEPMLERLEELKEYPFYFQFTLTGYGTDIEPGVPHKKEEMIRVFQQLSERIGSRRVIWRYDPILFKQVYTPEYHRKAFSQIASALNGCTEKCVISFVDTYAKNRKSMENLKVYDLEKEQLLAFAGSLAEEADRNHMTIASCAEAIDLSACGKKQYVFLAHRFHNEYKRYIQGGCDSYRCERRDQVGGVACASQQPVQQPVHSRGSAAHNDPCGKRLCHIFSKCQMQRYESYKHEEVDQKRHELTCYR